MGVRRATGLCWDLQRWTRGNFGEGSNNWGGHWRSVNADCGMGEDARPPLLLAYELGEHLLGIDGDEQTPAAGEHLSFGVENFGHVDVPAAADAYLA